MTVKAPRSCYLKECNYNWSRLLLGGVASYSTSSLMVGRYLQSTLHLSKASDVGRIQKHNKGIAKVSSSSAAISGSISESNSKIGVVEGIHIDDYMFV